MKNSRQVPGSDRESRRRVSIERAGTRREDWVVVEEPLEIRIQDRPYAITMRTPGRDPDLGAGLLFAEGVIAGRHDLLSLQPAPAESGGRLDSAGSEENDSGGRSGEPRGQRLLVELTEEAFDRWARHRVERELIATSACGVCGKPSLEDLWRDWPGREQAAVAVDWPRPKVAEMVAAMRERQALFQHTGGVHAAALFDLEGRFQALAEDVGRHNAVDKVVGARLLESGCDLEGLALVVSGRAGYEIVQKAIRARAAAVVSVGAASSLAVELALECGLELISFAGRGSGNRHLR